MARAKERSGSQSDSASSISTARSIGGIRRRRAGEGHHLRKGERLATPPQLAAAVAKRDWTRVTLDWRGQGVKALVWSRPALWRRVDKHNLVLLVVVRDPEGHQHDDYFVCTDLDADPAWVASHYAGRWSIEVCFRDAKQNLGGENPQSWRAQGPSGPPLSPCG